MFDIIVVGGGPAGLTAAVYALRAGKQVLVLEKNGFGGQIAYSPKVENIPGTISISGSEFAEKLTEQVLELGAQVEIETVTRVECEGKLRRVYTQEGSAYEAGAVILALGVQHRLLGLEGEEELIGHGLSFCAVCDGAFYAGGHVAMIGGGNSALQEALLLSQVCRQVTVVQNLPFLTGEQKLQQALAEKENVRVILDTVVTEYISRDGELTGLMLRSGDGSTQDLEVDGAFLAVGLVPENEAFAQVAQLDDRGYFQASEDCLTQTPGVFVAGDCRQKHIRQVTTAAADGAIAALAAVRYVEGHV